MHRKFILAMLMVLLVVASIAPSMAQEATQIEAWIAFTDHRLDWAKERAAEFNEMYPEFEVVIQEFTDYEPLLEAYTLAQEQGTQPAIIQLFEVGTQFAKDTGWFKSVNEIIAGREEVMGQPVNFADIVEPVSAYYTVDGEWASVAWNSSTPILYVNMNMMEEVGLTADDIPTTWQETEAVCAAFEEKIAAGELSGCISWPNHGWFFEQWLAQQNQLLVNNDNGRADRATEVFLTTPEALNIVEWHQAMYDKGYFYYSGIQRDWSGVVQSFNALELPMIMTSSASAGSITSAAAENGVEVITSTMVYDDEYGWQGNLIGGATMWVSAGLDPAVEEAATAFLLYFSNTENSADWHKISGYIPIRYTSIDLLNSEGWYEENPNFLVASNQINGSTVTPATQGAIFGTFVETRDLVTQAIEDAMLQGGDIAEIMAEAEEQANLALEEYNFLYVE